MEQRDGQSRILIVEDEQIVAQDIEQTLVDLGYRIAGVTASGEEALDLAGREETDLALMDIMLAGPMDGVRAAKVLKSRFDIPVIYLTAYTNQETFERAKGTDPYGYLVKPFDERSLYFAIEIALNRRVAEKEIHTLRGLLPICASCKKIRDDSGYWQQLEVYLGSHSELRFSHGLCPECRKKLYPDLS